MAENLPTQSQENESDTWWESLYFSIYLAKEKDDVCFDNVI